MRLVVVDPGGYSGYIRAFVHGDQIEAEPGFFGPDDHHHELRRMLAQERLETRVGEELVIVYERFDHRNREAALLISVEYIGVIKEFFQSTTAAGPRRLVAQGSDQAKHFATDDKLIAMGLPFQTPKSKKPQKDMNDALRHFVYFVCNNKTAPPEARMALLNRLKP
jgi:hypothetical protein